MAEKPTELEIKYEAWRGTPEHLGEIATAVRDEIQRAARQARVDVWAEIERNVQAMKVEAETTLRKREGLLTDASLSPEVQSELAGANAALDAYAERQRGAEAALIERATRLKFGYRDKAGRFRSDQKPEFLRNVVNPVGVEMSGSCVARPSASIGIRIQNQPWEALTLNVQGDDPDWVSSAAMPLDALMSARQPSHVVFLRNQWFRSFVGVSIWLLIITPVGNLFEQFDYDRLLSLPISLLLAGIIALGFQKMTLPLLLTRRQPSGWLELTKTTFPYLAGALLRFGLDMLAARIGDIRP